MSQPPTIVSDTPRAMHAFQEVSVLRAAVRNGTAPPATRYRTALLLNQLDAFGETIDLLTSVPADALDYYEQMLLTAAYFARQQGEDTRHGLKTAHSALALAATEVETAAALAEQAKALFRMDRPEAARGLLCDALARDPTNREACKRLTVDLLLSGEAQAALDVTDDLIARGVAHSRLFAARATALARLGEIATARDLLDLERFLWRSTITVPPGWDDLASFNAALADELLAHSSLRYERHGTASIASWRIDSLVAGGGPLARLLVDRIIEAIQRRVAMLNGIDHPWVAAMPYSAVVRSWCVITEGAGHETWHMHPYGWMSGVYYVAVPDAVSTGSDANGCLMLGLSDGLVGETVAESVGHHLIRPQAGLLAAFPSHTYHRTFAHGAPGKRICVAFDVEPVRPA